MLTGVVRIDTQYVARLDINLGCLKHMLDLVSIQTS